MSIRRNPSKSVRANPTISASLTAPNPSHEIMTELASSSTSPANTCAVEPDLSDQVLSKSKNTIAEKAEYEDIGLKPVDPGAESVGSEFDSNNDSADPLNTNDFLNSLGHLLEQYQSFESRQKDPDTAADEGELNDGSQEDRADAGEKANCRCHELSGRFDQAAIQIGSLRQLVENRSEQYAAGDDHSGFELLTQKIDQIATLMEESKRQREFAVKDEAKTARRHMKALADRMDQTDSTLNSLVSSFDSLVRVMEDASIEKTVEPDVSEQDEAESAWEKQKRALLENYNTNEPVDHGSVRASSTPNAEATTSESSPETPVLPTISPLQDSGLAQSEGQLDSPEVKDLREQLKERLRRAEVEISIERAKISRQKRELEEQQSEIERQIAKLDSSKDGSGCEKQRRWTRFMGRSNKGPKE